MLTPEFLLQIAKAAEERASELNIYLTGRIAKRIKALFDKKGEVDIIPSSVLDARKMKESGLLIEEISQAIQEELPKLRQEVKQAFVEGANQIDVDNRKFTKHIVNVEIENGNLKGIELPELSDYEKSGIPKKIEELNLTQKEVRLLERAYKKTNGTLKNLTGTMAQACQRSFIEAVDKAYWKATHGVSIDTAISEAVTECAKDGVMVIYPSGHKDRIETAVARAVRTGVAQAAGDITLARCAEMGVNAVIVSSHLGARYTDKVEPANHMSWQGKVYSLDWNNPTLKDYNVTEEEKEENKGIFAFLDKVKNFLTRHKEKTSGDFIEKTGYGTGEGLCGWNCRHHFGPYYKGISINNNPDYDSEESKKRYDNEQKQRRMEREIRATKREIEAQKAIGGDISQLQAKLRKQTVNYHKFSDDVEIRAKDNRLRIANGASTQYPNVQIQIQNNGSMDRGASAHSVNTGRKVSYNENADYRIEVSGYSEEVNAAMSKAACEVAKAGSKTGYEYGVFVDLKTGEIGKYVTDGLAESVRPDYNYFEGRQNCNVAFLHNHNTDTELSFPDVGLMANDKEINIVAAVRNDGIITLVESNGKKTNEYLPLKYLEETNKIRKDLMQKYGRVRDVEVEIAIRDVVIRDYAKEGMKVYGDNT